MKFFFTKIFFFSSIFHHFFIDFSRPPKSYFFKISQKITKNRHFWPFFGPAGRPPRAPLSPIPDLRDLGEGRDSARGGIISTPKIDFRADFRPSSAGFFPCFDLLKFRRPLRLYIKMMFHEI